MKIVTPNKERYVKLHGYDFIDASDMVNMQRPPSWSKILAVKSHLPQYDWVFWNDAVSQSVYFFQSLWCSHLNIEQQENRVLNSISKQLGSAVLWLVF